MTISGCSYAEVIGDPIAHSKSPLIHSFWLDHIGLEAQYRATLVRADELGSYFAERRVDPLWRGCNVTMPHKVSALRHVRFVDPRSERIGATNCIRHTADQLLALNTDVDGVHRAFYAGGGITKTTVACLIGTGGAARAALHELSDVGVRRVNVIARYPFKALRLLREFGRAGDGYGFEAAAAAMRGARCLINATPLGSAGGPEMPDAVFSALSVLRKRAFVFDMVYSPVETALLKNAGDRGLKSVDGLTMLIEQARTSFYHLFEKHPPLSWDAELRELLTQ